MRQDSTYRTVDELPNLLSKGQQQPSFKSVDELPDLKKKEPSEPLSKDSLDGGLDGTISTNKEPIPTIELYKTPSGGLVDDPFTRVKKSKDLSQRKRMAAIPSSGKAGEVFTEVPDEGSIKEAENITSELEGEGFGKDFIEAVSDMPEAAFRNPTTSKETLINLYGNNPVKFKQLTNEAKIKYAIQDAAAQKSYNELEGDKQRDEIAKNIGILEGNKYSGDEQMPESMQQFYDIVRQKQGLIDKNIDDPEQKKKYHGLLRQTYAPAISPESLDFKEEYQQSGLGGAIDINQYAGLKTLELFEPEKYKTYLNVVQDKIVPQWNVNVQTSPEGQTRGIVTDSLLAEKLGGTISQLTTNQRIGKEEVLRELALMGANNEYDDLTSQQNDLKQLYKDAETDEQRVSIITKSVENENRMKQLEQVELENDKKYPLTAKLKYENQVKEIVDDIGMGVGGFMYNRYAHGVGTGVDAVENLVTNIFGSESDKTKLRVKRIGEGKQFEADTYLPESERRTGSPVIIQASDELKKKAKEIINGRSLSSLSDEERQQLNNLIANNQSQIKTITNPEAGKSKNFLSKATGLSIAGFTADIGAFLTKMGMLQGVGLGAKAAEATTLFTDGYDAAYNKKISEGASSEDAHEYGILHGAVLSLMTKFGSKYETIMNTVKGGKSPLSKYIAGLSEKQWNKLAGEAEPLLKRVGKTVKGVAKEQGKMIGTFGVAAPTAASIADNVFYDDNKSVEQIAKEGYESAKEMLIGSAGFIGLGLVKGAMKSKASPLEKMALWELGDNPELGIARIDEAVKKNEITSEEGTQKKEIIERVSKLIPQVPETTDKGKVLDDQQRIDYLYRLALKESYKEKSKILPEKQAEEAKQKALVIDKENQIELEGLTEKQANDRKDKLDKAISKVDDKGKPELSDKEMAYAKAELEAIDNTIEKRKDTSIKEEELPDLSIPIERTNEKEIPIGENVPPEVKGEPEKITQPIELSVEDKPTDVVVVDAEQQSGKDVVVDEGVVEKASNVGGDVEQNLLDNYSNKGRDESSKKVVQKDGTVLDKLDGVVYSVTEPTKEADGKVDKNLRQIIPTNDKSLDGQPLWKDMSNTSEVPDIRVVTKENAPPKPKPSDFSGLPEKERYKAYSEATEKWENDYTEKKQVGTKKQTTQIQSPIFDYDPEYKGQTKEEIGYKKIKSKAVEQSLSTKPEIKNEEPQVKIPIPKEEGGITETKTGQGVPETETGEKIRQNILAAAEGKKSERSKRIAMEEEAAKYGEEGAKILSNIGGEPPKEPPKPTEEKGGKDKLNDKGILNHLFSAENVPESAKSGFKEKGLKYNTASQKEAEMVAKSIIEEYGIDDAVLLAEAQKFDGDVNSLIYAESLNRLAKLEEAAKTPEEKFEFTKKFAEVGIKYDEAGRKGGRFNAAINYFYKKSPLGIKMIENAKRKEAFEEWSKPKDKSWKEFFDEMIKEPEFDAIVKEQVKEGMKKERAEAREARIKKVDEFFDKAKDEFKGGAAYSTIIPPKVITAALEGMKQAYHAGENVVKLVQEAVDYISEQLGHDNWDKEKFRKEWNEKLKDKENKKPLTDEEVKAKILDKFRKKLKGLTDKEKEEVVRKSFQKIVESGGLDYADFKKIIADITGRGELTEAETTRLKELIKETNLVDEAGEKARLERTQEARKEYFEAQTKAAKASKELNEILYNRPNITKRLTSIMQLNTLGIPALINNPIYNIWNQTTLRLPVGLVKTVIDQAIKYGSGGKIAPETNIVSRATQAEFFSKLGLGGKEAFQQFFTGLNRADYTAKEIQGQQIRPATAWRDLISHIRGKKNLTGEQALDKSIQATVGIPAEMVARTLNLGDKPQRFAAEGAQASAFAKALGLKDIDYDLFIDFPREEAYMQYKKQGLSDAEAAKKADYIKDTIIKEGQRSTFQQDNMLNDVINRVFGGEQSGIGSLAKAVTISPYIKIPSNAYWSYYNLINPEVALLQSAIYGTKAGLKKSGKFNRFLGDKYNTSAEKDLNESKYWFAHAAVGMATRAVVVSLVGAGIVRPSNTADDTKKEREGEQNYEQQGTINVSKMFAAAQGKDPDEVNNGLNVGLRWFGHFGTMSDRIAKKNEEMTPEQKEKQDEFLNIAFGGLEVDALRDLNTGVFGNTSSLLTSVERGDFKNYGTNLINMFANVMQPAALAQVERAAMPYYTKQKADTFLGELNNTMLNRSKLYRDLTKQYPPSKIGIWGDKVEKKDNLPMRLFGISRANPDNFAQPIYEDYKRTSNTQFLPPSVKPEISGNGQTIKLPTKDAARLEELVGQQRKNLAAPYVNDMANFEGSNKTYSKLSDEEKIDKLNIIYDEGYKNGKELFLKEYPQYIIPEKTKQEKTEDKKESSANRKFRKAIKNK